MKHFNYKNITNFSPDISRTNSGSTPAPNVGTQKLRNGRHPEQQQQQQQQRQSDPLPPESSGLTAEKATTSEGRERKFEESF